MQYAGKIIKQRIQKLTGRTPERITTLRGLAHYKRNDFKRAGTLQKKLFLKLNQGVQTKMFNKKIP